MNSKITTSGFRSRPNNHRVIFISHSSIDNAFALRLTQDIGTNGNTIWIDDQQINPGSIWLNEINQGIEKCDFMLLIWSENAKNSEHVNLEYTSAMVARKSIIPLMIDDVDLPIILRRVRGINFKADYNQGLQELKRALEN
ncbi:toll/interleukin-1 receptor domain-containing protein [candidate division KSB1 bacterium]|nr:toll/interleukin-1 receptor domain-containing protein [candidate division KSB1 bacterium]